MNKNLTIQSKKAPRKQKAHDEVSTLELDDKILIILTLFPKKKNYFIEFHD